MLQKIMSRLRSGNHYAANAAELEQFNANGFFVREKVFSNRELDKLRNAAEKVHRRMEKKAASSNPPDLEFVDDKRFQSIDDSVVKWEWREGSGDIRSMEPFLHLHHDLHAIVDDPRLWAPAQSILGLDKLALFTDKLNFKRPQGAPFPFHQDSPYFALECKHVDQLLSMQIYLDEARNDNGCLWIIPGSHHQGILSGVQGKGVLDRLYTDMDLFQGEDPVAVTAPAGSVIYFHAHVIHGSKGNKSEQSRRAMVITYQPSGYNRWNTNQEREIRT